jgi:Zn-dependent protease
MDFDWVWMLKSAPAAFIGLTVHEYSHALAAYRLGDSTAKDEGRLSLNPIKHIDIIGFILILVAGFGWAKPVMFNPENLKKKNRDEIIISLAGPFSNLILGFIFIVIARLLYFSQFFNNTTTGIGAVNTIILWGIINFGLFIFNMLPIPPLDGSHIYLTYFNDINPQVTATMYKIGTWALLLIVLVQNRANMEIIPLGKITNFMTKICIQILHFN